MLNPRRVSYLCSLGGCSMELPPTQLIALEVVWLSIFTLKNNFYLTLEKPMKFLLAILAVFVLNTSYSGDSTPPAKNDPTWLVEVRVSIKSGNYEKAIQQLQSSNQTTSADWNNLMGYSLRQLKTPDLIGAESYYQAALNIDPKHKGALEYYGMLRLIKNDLTGAEELLARLDKICFFGCEEYSDLKEAIKKYKTKK